MVRASQLSGAGGGSGIQFARRTKIAIQRVHGGVKYQPTIGATAEMCLNLALDRFRETPL
jgi:hypothetical protein